MMGRTLQIPPPGASSGPPAASGAEGGTARGVPPAGSAHLHAKLLVLLLQAPEFLLQGVTLEELLQGQRGLVPAQPGDGREGAEHPRPGLPTQPPAHSPQLPGWGQTQGSHGREGSTSPGATPGG